MILSEFLWLPNHRHRFIVETWVGLLIITLFTYIYLLTVLGEGSASFLRWLDRLTGETANFWFGLWMF